jgi:hypothetical protein
MKKTIAMTVALSFVFWSVIPSTPHVPTALETIQQHLEMVEEHGHSHGFEKDFWWAMHGHQHDTNDHDHSPLYIVFTKVSTRDVGIDSWGMFIPTTKVPPFYKIRRPPKV